MTFDTRGYTLLAETPTHNVWGDRAGWGLLWHELTPPGPGITNEMVQQGRGAAPYAMIITRTDLPVGTVVFAPDLGVSGSYWRFNGTAWLPDRPFMLVLAQGSIATPFATQTNPAIGFNGYGSGITPPLGFWTLGRRLSCRGDLVRGAGTSATATTSVTLGGVVIASLPWGSTTREQRPDISVRITSATQATTSGIVAPGGTITGSTPATADYAISGMDTVAKTLSIGISESASTTGNYGLIDFAVEVLA